MTRHSIFIPCLGVFMATGILLSAHGGNGPVATEPPATTTPPTSLPAPSTTVPEPLTSAPSTTTAPVATPVPGEVATPPTPPGTWQIGQPVTCTDPFGNEAPAWCDPRVLFWRFWDNDLERFVCYVTPAGIAAGHHTCPADEDETSATLVVTS